MCPKLTELLSWNGPTVHVCCFMLAKIAFESEICECDGHRRTAYTTVVPLKHSLAESIFVSRVQKTAKKSSLAEKFVSWVTR